MFKQFDIVNKETNTFSFRLNVFFRDNVLHFWSALECINILILENIVLYLKKPTFTFNSCDKVNKNVILIRL